jgi:hypothetical protein
VPEVGLDGGSIGPDLDITSGLRGDHQTIAAQEQRPIVDRCVHTGPRMRTSENGLSEDL